MKTTKYKIGIEPQTDDDGTPCFAWWVETVGDGNDEAVAGGFCRTEAEARSDAQSWIDANT